jgi:hypothetical protein
VQRLHAPADAAHHHAGCRVLKLALAIAGTDLCLIEIWEDKVPALAAALRALLPVTSILQHGKIVGDLVFFGLPALLPAQNSFPLQDICRMRRTLTGSAGGSVCFYGPRQQICIYYGDDVCDEPFELSYIGEIVAGAQAMELAGMRCWTSAGETVTLRLA